MADKTFLRITNKMIYEKIETIDTHLDKLNGKVLWHTWAIGFIVLILAALVKAAIN